MANGPFFSSFWQEFEMDIYVEGSVMLGDTNRGCNLATATFNPPEPDEVYNVKVFLGAGSNRIEITNALTEKQLNQIRSGLIEEVA